jgi:hypothetical protein
MLIICGAIGVMAAAEASCGGNPDPLLPVSRPEHLATVGEGLIGRPIAFERIRVTGTAAAGGFYIGIGNRHVYVLPERDGVIVRTAETVALTGVIRRMQADIARRLDLAEANYDLYIYGPPSKAAPCDEIAAAGRKLIAARLDLRGVILLPLQTRAPAHHGRDLVQDQHASGGEDGNRRDCAQQPAD